MKVKPPYEGKSIKQKNVCVIKIAFYDFPSYGGKTSKRRQQKMLCYKKTWYGGNYLGMREMLNFQSFLYGEVVQI